MRFMVTLITDGTATADLGPEEMREMGQRMGSFMEEIESAGVLLHTDALAPSSSARTLRYGKEGRAVVTDGPFTESKEQMAGYMVIECGDLDDAMDWVRRMPVPGGALEVRPIADRSAPDRS